MWIRWRRHEIKALENTFNVYIQRVRATMLPMSRFDRTAKYNQLLRIKEEFDTMAVYVGLSVLPARAHL